MEKDSAPVTLGADRLLDRWLKLWNTYKYVILSAMITGFAAHMFAFTNKLLNRDESGCLFSKGAGIESGRWGILLAQKIIPNFSMPWLFGILTLVLMTAALCYVVKTLKIRKPVLQILLSALVVSFPSLTGTFSYMFTSSSYGAAFLLCVLAAWLASKDSWKGYMAGILCGVLSVSIYQGYIMITAGILLVGLLRQTLYSEEPIRKIFCRALRLAVFLAACLVCYFLITTVLLQRRGMSLAGYASSAVDGNSNLISRLISVYHYFILILTDGYASLIPLGLPRILHLLVLVMLLPELLLWAIHCRKPGRISFAALLLLLFPMVITGIFLASAPESVHTLVLYSFISLYFLIAVVIEEGSLISMGRAAWNRIRGLLFDGVLACLLLASLCNISIGNEAYLKLHLSYENSYSQLTTIMAQIQSMPGYTRETPIAILADFSYPEFYDQFDNIRYITGVQPLTIQPRVAHPMLQYYCGQEASILRQDQCAPYYSMEQVINMPVYPDNGSIAMIDGTVVVKMFPFS